MLHGERVTVSLNGTPVIKIELLSQPLPITVLGDEDSTHNFRVTPMSGAAPSKFAAALGSGT